jgi:hypothetical protein
VTNFTGGQVFLSGEPCSATWHRKGFQFYWRGQSRRPGRPRINPEIHDLIRRIATPTRCGVRRAFMGSCSARHQNQLGDGRALDAVAAQGPLPDLAVLRASSGRCKELLVTCPVMRDWLLILAPIAVVAYFLAYPQQFTAFATWLEGLVR